MGLLVEARRLSAMGPDGLLFTSVSATVDDGDLAVIVGVPHVRRTALMLALSGRFVISGGSLSTDSHKSSTRRAQGALRSRVAIAHAPPALRIDTRMRVGELLAERRLACGGKRLSVDSFWDAFELMAMQRPALDELAGELDPVEQLLLSVALCYAQQADAIGVADADGGFSPEDQRHVRAALGQITAAGRTILATSADNTWGTVRIAVAGDGPDEPAGRTQDRGPARYAPVSEKHRGLAEKGRDDRGMA